MSALEVQAYAIRIKAAGQMFIYKENNLKYLYMPDVGSGLCISRRASSILSSGYLRTLGICCDVESCFNITDMASNVNDNTLSLKRLYFSDFCFG